jgi:tRNA A37 threonylcarbamoyladenosine modification protein TsaB
MVTFKELIKAHLEKMAAQDFAFAERYKLETKSLDKCLQYITTQAKKQAKNGCAAIEDAVVYGWAVHYYQEDDVKTEEVKAKVVAPKTEKPKEVAKVKEIKPIKALVRDKKNEGKCVQLDLFGDF